MEFVQRSTRNVRKFGDMEVQLPINNVMNSSIQKDLWTAIVEWIKMEIMWNVTQSKFSQIFKSWRKIFIANF